MLQQENVQKHRLDKSNASKFFEFDFLSYNRIRNELFQCLVYQNRVQLLTGKFQCRYDLLGPPKMLLLEFHLMRFQQYLKKVYKQDKLNVTKTG